MSLKSSIIALAGMVGKCQENSRSLKQCLELGLLEVSKDAPNDWSLVKTETGSVDITLPESFSNIYIIVREGDHIVASTVFPKDVLLTDAKEYRTGYYGGATFYSATTVSVSKTTFKLLTVNKEGSIITANCSMSVYAN